MDGAELNKWSETRDRDDKGRILNPEGSPVFPSVSNILERATELYKFVEEK